MGAVLHMKHTLMVYWQIATGEVVCSEIEWEFTLLSPSCCQVQRRLPVAVTLVDLGR